MAAEGTKPKGQIQTELGTGGEGLAVRPLLAVVVRETTGMKGAGGRGGFQGYLPSAKEKLL